MIHHSKIKAALFVGLLSLAAFTQAKTEEVAVKPALDCAGASKLLTLVGQKKIFDQSPEQFLNSAQDIFTVKSKEVKSKGEPFFSHDYTYSAVSGDWLISGVNKYDDMTETRALKFSYLTVYVNPACFPSSKSFINLAGELVGEGYREGSIDGTDETFTRDWYWADPDENLQRVLAVSAEGQEYKIVVKIEPSPTED